MDWKSKNVKAYDDYAIEFSQSFAGIGPRINDIEVGIKLAGAGPKSRIVEIGCGDGRDAEYIIKECSWYEGFDPSSGLLALANQRLPKTNFILADALTYNYPRNVDLIFAFASLLHVNKTDLRKVLAKIIRSLRSGGILYISLKESHQYTKIIKEDECGAKRIFYLYNPKIIESLRGELLTVAYESHYKLNSIDWFTLALRKG